MSLHLVTYDKVGFHYTNGAGEATSRRILDNVCLNIRKGEFVTVVGPSGCGKSTLLNLILGSRKPTAGIVTLDGVPVDRVDGNRGVVFQDYSLFPHLTVLDNIALGILLEQTTLPERLLRLPKYWRVLREARARAREYVKKIGLSDADAKKYPHELSGGMRQRVAIAAAVILQPKILVMDEPNSALDDSTRREIQAFTIQQWEDFDLTVLFVTHNVEEAVHLGTRLIGLSQHWCEDDGKTCDGARIVTDILLPRADENRRLDHTFVEIMKHIREEVLDDTKRIPTSKFRLEHPDVVKMITV